MANNLGQTSDQLIAEFWEWTDKCYGVYLDALDGFLLVRADREKMWKESEERLGLPIMLGTLTHARLHKPGQLPPQHTHSADMQGAIARNTGGGPNDIMIGRMTIVSIYSFWERQVRERLKDSYGEHPQVPVMGDLRILRRLILHNHARGDGELKKLEVLLGYKEDAAINPTKQNVEQIIDQISIFVAQFRKTPKAFFPNKLKDGNCGTD